MDLFRIKKVTLGAKEAELRELSVGLIYKIDEGIAKDDVLTILKECSNLSVDEIKALGVNTANTLYDEILKLTYGDKNTDERSKKK